MSLLRFNLISCQQVKGVWCKRLCSSLVTAEEPKYPPILDQSPLAVKLRRKEEWHNLLKKHETVEEKLIEVNMPKYYGWRSVMVNETSVPYDFLPYAQFSTRTHLELADEIQPLYNDEINKKADDLVLSVRQHVQDAILLADELFRQRQDLKLPKNEEEEPEEMADVRSRSTVHYINRVLLSSLGSEVKHLREAQVTKDPRLEAFWFLGGIEPSPEKIEEREYRAKLRNHEGQLDPSLVHLPVNKPVQYIGKPILQLRSKHPLPPVTDLQDSNPEASGIPYIPYEPQVLHLEEKFRHGASIPGFWPGDPSEFGLLSIHSCDHLLERPPHFGEDEHIDAFHSSAIFASYAWLLGQACYQGFSTFHDPTYPLVTQTVLTNGRLWSFYLYQLNTTVLHTTNSTENPRCNTCWGTRPMELYQKIDGGSIIGFNDKVLKQLIKMYLLEPTTRPGVEMKPYLGKKYLVSHIDYEERRDWLEKFFKHTLSNRPRHWRKPEMYAWEKIKMKYPFLHRGRAKLRWFELEGTPPDCRRLDHMRPVRKPRVLREHRYKDLFYPTFFPGTNLTPPKKMY